MRLRVKNLTGSRLETARKHGIFKGEFVELTDEVFRQHLTPHFAIESDWPLWAIVVAAFRNDADTGVGDTLRRELGNSKGERFKRWHESVFGVWQKPCNCAGKLKAWNVMFNYLTDSP